MVGKHADSLKQFIDGDFLLKLEYHLSKAFKDSPDNTVKYFWCDGILIEENIYTKSTIEAEKQIIAKAWIGVDGQDIYKMVITLGKHSFESYLNGADINNYLPEGNISNWLSIQPNDKTIEIRLN